MSTGDIISICVSVIVFFLAAGLSWLRLAQRFWRRLTSRGRRYDELHKP